MLEKLELLIVDDDSLIRDAIKSMAPSHWNIIEVSSHIDFNVKESFHGALVDLHLTNNLKFAEGLDVMSKIHQSHPQIPIIAMSGDLNRELMEKCLDVGAKRFLAKPIVQSELLHCLEKLESFSNLCDIIEQNRTQELTWIGQSNESNKLLKEISLLKSENGPILIEGPTGSGKEIIANLIHHQDGPHRPFITVNAGALTDNLFESEFFGHVKGAFTGADVSKLGLAEAASGGDLFIDEIEALPLNQQAKLLRFLENGEIRRVGTTQSIKVSTRIIVASNSPLNKLVEEQKFREDLYFRLAVHQINIPPLSKRKNDIKLIASFYLKNRNFNQKILSEDAIQLLESYNWPGNVRELKHLCEQLSLHAPLPIIRSNDIVNIFPLIQSNQNSMTSQSHDLDSFLNMNLDLNSSINMYEAFLINKVLSNESDIDKAANQLGISRSTLYKKIKDHKIDWRST